MLWSLAVEDVGQLHMVLLFRFLVELGMPAGTHEAF